LQLKRFKHKTKLYCEEKDLQFLEEWKLLKFYDEIDTTTLAKFKPDLDDSNF
jgi:hypothetical protein